MPIVPSFLQKFVDATETESTAAAAIAAAPKDTTQAVVQSLFNGKRDDTMPPPDSAPHTRVRMETRSTVLAMCGSFNLLNLGFVWLDVV